MNPFPSTSPDIQPMMPFVLASIRSGFNSPPGPIERRLVDFGRPEGGHAGLADVLVDDLGLELGRAEEDLYRAVVSNEQVGIPVHVVVTGHDHPVEHRAVDPNELRDVLEGPVPAVAQKPGPHSGSEIPESSDTSVNCTGPLTLGRPLSGAHQTASMGGLSASMTSAAHAATPSRTSPEAIEITGEKMGARLIGRHSTTDRHSRSQTAPHESDHHISLPSKVGPGFSRSLRTLGWRQ